MLDDVGETAVERYQGATFGRRCREQPFVRHADQLLIASERHVMTRLAENRPDGIGKVLVQLERGHDYAAGTGTIVSRASSAA